MIKKLIFLSLSLNFLWGSFTAYATLEEEIRRIDQVCSILGSTTSYAGALNELVEKKEFDSPFLTQIVAAMKEGHEKVEATPPQRYLETDAARFTEEMIFQGIYRDGVFLKNIKIMLHHLKESLQNDQGESLFYLNESYQKILREMETYMLRTQQATLFVGIEEFGRSPEFKEKYKATLFTKEDERGVKNNCCDFGADLRGALEFQKTTFWKFMQDCSKFSDTGVHTYSYEEIKTFEAVVKDIMQAPEFISVDLKSTVTGHHMLEFCEILEPYEILKKGLLDLQSALEPAVSMYDRLLRSSNSSTVKYRGSQIKYESEYDRTKEAPKAQKAALERRNKAFDDHKKAYLTLMEAVSSAHLDDFTGFIEKVKAERRRIQKEEKKRKKQKIVQEATLVNEELPDDKKFSVQENLGGASAAAVVDPQALKNKGIPELKILWEKDAVHEEEGEETLDEWWKVYQTKNVKEKKMPKGAASAEEEFSEGGPQFKLSHKAFTFFRVMGGYTPWDSKLDATDLNAFQSEIVRQFESYLKKEDYAGSVIPKARPGSRPFFVLPNLKPRFEFSNPYLLFRQPHLPHGRSENTLYPALKHFYHSYFKEAGLSLGNVVQK